MKFCLNVSQLFYKYKCTFDSCTASWYHTWIFVLANMAQNSLDFWGNAFNKSDPKLQHLFLVKWKSAPLLIMLTYALFVFKIGPSFMKNRNPYVLKTLILFYNLIQIIVNCTLVYLGVQVALKQSFFCPMIPNEITIESMEVAKLVYYYYLLKIFDLTDTIFFILRKKDKQVSFLHTYHHLSMIFGSWMAARAYPGGPFLYLGIINCAVHVFMYFYYLLAAWNSRFSKNTTLKKSITTLQLLQDCFNGVYYSAMLLAPGCKFPKEPLIIMVPNVFVISYLFAKFYFDSYIRSAKKMKKI